MSPDEIKTLTTLLTILQEFASKGTIWGSIAMFLIGPYVLQVLYAWHLDKQRKADMVVAQANLATVKRMYEDNVVLVKDTLKLANGYQDVIVTNTAAMTKACDLIERHERDNKGR